MALPFNIEPPRWLTEEVEWARGLSGRGIRELAIGAQIGMQAEQQNINMASGLLQLQNQQNQLDLTKMKIQQVGAGNEEVAAWMQETGGNPVYMVNSPYTGTNPVAAETISNAQLRASQSLAVNQAKEDQKNFIEGMNGISGADRSVIRTLMGPNGLPTPQAWQALNTARQRAGLPAAGMPEQPASVRVADEIIKRERDATTAEAAGDTALAQQLRDSAALMRQQGEGSQMEITGYDDQGRPIIRMGRGGSNAPTVATQSQAQQKLLRYENTIQIMSHLDKVLQPEHLGLRGVAGELLVDRTLSQLVPEAANQDRIDARSALVALREGLMREISNDNRFSNADREEINRALPSSGVFESLPDAKQRMDTVRRIITERARVYAIGLGQPVPSWAMTPEEIKAAVVSGKMTREAAEQSLRTYHGFR